MVFPSVAAHSALFSDTNAYSQLNSDQYHEKYRFPHRQQPLLYYVWKPGWNPQRTCATWRDIRPVSLITSRDKCGICMLAPFDTVRHSGRLPHWLFVYTTITLQTTTLIRPWLPALITRSATFVEADFARGSPCWWMCMLWDSLPSLLPRFQSNASPSLETTQLETSLDHH